ncbi:hypothetical protein E3N88_02350 [Mikania micrantha]|uniref:Homeobox domain-containing protein n=1 Tax=Mikania micrantha TaxID=192012 RepID=A0A5N6Q3J1_9ASTR|nr:hypothetical protein E3N88_02350 [Mikania micrantha]
MKNTMETQQQADIQDFGNKNSSSYPCRQSSTRWTPTSDQIRILKELYYNNGIRSPTAEQIQRIAAQLRQYGKIEGKNVFYWFQNHKARERQKKRFTPTAPPPPSPFSDHINHHHPPTAAAMQIQSHHHYYHHQEQPHVYAHQHKLYTTHHIGVGSSSSQGVMAVGCGYGSVAMEKSFRKCSISPPGESKATGGIGRNIGSRSRIGVDSCSFFDKFKPKTYEILENDHDGQDEEQGETSTEIETLPLFPIHDDTHHDFFSMKTANLPLEHSTTGGCYTGGSWYLSDERASLELSLNSYGYYN